MAEEIKIADLKPYQGYQDSGLPWVGTLPKGWSTERAKWLFRKMDRPVRPEDQVVTCFRDGRVTLRSNRRTRGFTEALYELGYQGIRRGDLVIHAMDAFAGAIGVSDSDGKGTPVYAVCQPQPGVNARYYAYVVREMARSQWIQALSRGIRERSTDFRYDTFGTQFVPFPPPEDQDAIVRFLGWVTSRQDRAIRARRKEIALVNEQKRAITNSAILHGLDSNVQLRPSGTSWLGDIPSHWEVRRLKFVASHIVDCLHATPRYSESGTHPAIRTADIFPGVVFVEGARRISAGDYAKWTSRLVPTEGDILYSREGERFGIAACVPPGVELCISQRMMVFRIKGAFDPSFVMHVLNARSTYAQALQDVMGATAPHVNISTIKNYFLALPPEIGEQREIVAHIQRECAPLDVTTSKLEREIELILEYRTRLVSDIVTGKLDVREAAMNLPKEVDGVAAKDMDPGLEESEFEEEGVEA